MENKRNITAIITLCAVNLILSLIFVLRLPDIVPTHFNAQMICDGEGSKWTALLTSILPFLGAVVIPINAKFSQNGKKNENPVFILAFACAAIFVLLNWVTLLMADSGAKLGEKCEFPRLTWITCIALGILFIILGNIMPTVKQNGLFGFRIKWTLESEDCWRVTHRFFGSFSLIGGIIFTAVSMLLMICKAAEIVGVILLLFFTAALIAITVVYAYNHRNRDN